MLRDWATQAGITVERALTSGHDCRLDGIAVEVKLSLLWGGGEFVFQQIRDQDYAVACLLGLQPLRVHLWVVPKDILRSHSTGQHTGAAAQDTKWLRFQANSPPTWLSPYGDTLAKAKAALKQTDGSGR